jgi:hexosaminidase
MGTNLNILPEPKRAEVSGDFFRYHKKLVCTLIVPEAITGWNLPALLTLPETAFYFKQNEQDVFSYSAVISMEDDTRGKFFSESIPEPAESYRLSVDRKKIEILSRDKAGFLYGFMTLNQLLRDSESSMIPCCDIIDWPDLRMRGVHLDLKGYLPDFSSLEDIFKTLGEYKINTVLLEYEDKIKYHSHPAISASNALTHEQVRSLIKTATDYGISIIPLIQSLGHAEYILKGDRYANLRERPDSFQQLCPSREESFRLIGDLVEEILDLHHDSEFFHIGGDETRHLGECSDCRKYAEEHGKYTLYAEYLSKIAKNIISRGKTPVLWDDMITRHAPDLISLFPPETVFMYWNYFAVSETLPFCPYQDVWVVSRKIITDNLYREPAFTPFRGRSAEELIAGAEGGLPQGGYVLYENLAETDKEFLRKYGESDDTGGKSENTLAKKFPFRMKSLPFIRFFREKGFRVIGAAAAQSAHDTILPNPQRFIPNIRLWTDQARRHNLPGVVATAWMRNNAPDRLNGGLPGLWYPFLSLAEYGWNTSAPGPKEFDVKFAKRFFGIAGDRIGMNIRSIRKVGWYEEFSTVRSRFLKSAEDAKRNKTILMYYAAVSRVMHVYGLYRQLDELRQNLVYRNRRGIEEKLYSSRYEDCKRRIREEILAAEHELKEVLCGSVNIKDAEDFIAGWFMNINTGG